MPSEEGVVFSLEAAKNRLIERTLASSGGDVSAAAPAPGVDRAKG